MTAHVTCGTLDPMTVSDAVSGADPRHGVEGTIYGGTLPPGTQASRRPRRASRDCITGESFYRSYNRRFALGYLLVAAYILLPLILQWLFI